MDKRSLPAFIAISMGVFCLVADQTGVQVALPSISEFFNSDLPTTQWVLISYVLAISISLLPMGRLSDMVGHKKIYLVGFMLISTTTFVAGLAPSIIWLIVASFIRGVGSGMTQGTSMALVVAIFGPGKGGKALGSYISVVGLGSALGPLISGYILTSFNWRVLYYLLSGIGIVAMSSAALFVQSDRTPKFKVTGFKFDWVGAVLFTVGISCFLQGITWSPNLGYADIRIISALGISSISLIVFVFWEIYCNDPMMDLRLFKSRMFSSGIGSAFLYFMGTSTTFLFMPFYLQIALGYTPYQMGMFSGAGALTMAVVGIFAGQLSDKFGPNGFTTAGISISVAGLAILANLNMDSSWVHPLAGMVCCSFGLGTFYGPNNKIILASVPRNFHGVVSGFIHLARNSSTVISIAVGILVVTTFMSSMGFAPTLAGLSSDTDFPVLNSFVNGMRVGFIAFATILILALAVSLCGGTYEEIEVAD